jgi:hypothetical protein
MDESQDDRVASAEPEDVNVTATRRRLSADDSMRMRELADQIQTMITELGDLTKSYTDLDDDDRTAYRFTPNLARAAGNAGVYIEIVDGWYQESSPNSVLRPRRRRGTGGQLCREPLR